MALVRALQPGMAMFSNVRLRIAASVMKRILTAALPPEQVREAADRLELNTHALENGNGLLALSSPRTIWGVLQRMTGDPHVGLRAATAMTTEDLGLFAELLKSYPDLNGVYTGSLRFLDLIHTKHRPMLRVIDDVAELRWGTLMTRASADFLALAALRISQELVPGFYLREQWFPHALEANEVQLYEDLFGCPVKSRGELVGFCDASLLSRPIATASLARRKELVREASGRLERVPRELLRSRIEAAYAEVCTDQGASVSQVARMLDMSSATLQRRLRDLGSTHRAELDKARYLRASDMLGRPMTVTEVATRVGFPEARAFRRAFRRWSGVSPAEFRRRRRAYA